jgi:hypothetical protein
MAVGRNFCSSNRPDRSWQSPILHFYWRFHLLAVTTLLPSARLRLSGTILLFSLFAFMTCSGQFHLWIYTFKLRNWCVFYVTLCTCYKQSLFVCTIHFGGSLEYWINEYECEYELITAWFYFYCIIQAAYCLHGHRNHGYMYQK